MHLRALPATTNGKPAVLGWFSVWQFAGRRSEDLAGEDFLEIGLAVQRVGTQAGKRFTFGGHAFVQWLGEESAELIEVHFVLVALVAGMARSGTGGGEGVPGAGPCFAPDANIGFMLHCNKLPFLMLRLSFT